MTWCVRRNVVQNLLDSFFKVSKVFWYSLRGDTLGCPQQKSKKQFNNFCHKVRLRIKLLLYVIIRQISIVLCYYPIKTRATLARVALVSNRPRAPAFRWFQYTLCVFLPPTRTRLHYKLETRIKKSICSDNTAIQLFYKMASILIFFCFYSNQPWLPRS